MFSMLTVAAEAPDTNQANEMRIRLFTAVAGIVAILIGLLLVRSANLYALLVALLIVGIGPVLGYALATNTMGRSIVPMLLGGVGSTLGVGVLSAIFWPILVGATLRSVSLGKLLLWSVISDIIGLLAVFLIVAPTMGQNPAWMQTGFLVWGILWSLGVSYALSK